VIPAAAEIPNDFRLHRAEIGLSSRLPIPSNINHIRLIRKDVCEKKKQKKSRIYISLETSTGIKVQPCMYQGCNLGDIMAIKRTTYSYFPTHEPNEVWCPDPISKVTGAIALAPIW